MISLLPRWRRFGAVALVFGAMAVSAAYGYLLVPRRLFPYEMLIRRNSVVARLLSPRLPAHDASGNLFASVEDLTATADPHGVRPMTGRSGVLIHDRARAEEGLNFFISAHAPVAMLMDMDAAILRKWTADASTVFPGSKRRERERFFRDAELLPDGGVLALFEDVGIVRLDRESRVVWSFPARVHHDLFLDSSGGIWALAHEPRTISRFRKDPLLDDVVLSLSPDGKLLRRVSILDCFWQSSYAPMLATLPPESEDILDANSVVVLDGSLADRLPAFRRGNLLVSSRNLSVVAVLDPTQGRVVWALNGLWRGQQSARLTSGHIVLFDDLGSMQKVPRVLEVDPFSQDVVWSFGGNVREPMLTGSGGSVERLRGGNTLIVEAAAGRAREVTPDGHVAWEFVNPNRVGTNKEFAALIYFMERVPRDLPFLSHVQVPGSRPAAPTGGG